MTVGEKIQYYRKKCGFSQEELGQKLLVSRQTISLWEMDKTLPTVDNLLRLKEVFGVAIDDILNAEQSPLETDSSQNSAEQALIEIIDKKRRARPKGGWKAGSILLFILSILSLPLAFITMAVTATDTDFPAWHYWIFFLYALIPIAAIVYGILLKKRRFRAKRQFITGGIMLGILCLFGLLLLLVSLTYSDSDFLLLKAEEIIGIDIPKYSSIMSEDDLYDGGGWRTTLKARCVVSFDDEDVMDFEREMAADDRWLPSLPTNLIGIVPFDYYDDFEYVLICNTDTKELNKLPEESGEYCFIGLFYDEEDNKMTIVEYFIECVA